jgi:hypothetical protein
VTLEIIAGLGFYRRDAEKGNGEVKGSNTENTEEERRAQRKKDGSLCRQDDERAVR